MILERSLCASTEKREIAQSSRGPSAIDLCAPTATLLALNMPNAVQDTARKPETAMSSGDVASIDLVGVAPSQLTAAQFA